MNWVFFFFLRDGSFVFEEAEKELFIQLRKDTKTDNTNYAKVKFFHGHNFK